MEFAIEVKQLLDGSYVATVDWPKGGAGNMRTPGIIVYADSAGEAYEILKERLERKGHTVLE